MVVPAHQSSMASIPNRSIIP
ncbi:TPA: hypothetical protein JZ200_001037 [Staphylococcus aureus]|nr:hypothetical protein [Staphylococcus aureus]MBR8893276.1 hypothetical protein [Staphylococcus aureus]MBR8936054.1 hypothetical protein [Staphylococcus aureus]MVG86834.1 hypothetical protein [Staphylococcus aureus]MVH09988.1 hypothetical protein [Staphylococcus aureus]